MAKLERLVPFILHYETGVGRKYLGLPFDRLFEKARRIGYADDPDDPGGATLCGVTLATYSAYCRKKGYPRPTVLRLKKMSPAQWMDIIKTMFWDRWRADGIDSQQLADILVDWLWCSGNYGISIPQRILGVRADGIVGPATLAAIRRHDPHTLFDRIHSARIAFVCGIAHAHPARRKFLAGWENRINSITWEGLVL